MTEPEENEESPLDELFFGELNARVAAVQAAPDEAKALELLRPADYAAFFSRATSRVASQLSDQMAAAWHAAHGASRGGARIYSHLAPPVPTVGDLMREVTDIGTPFHHALAVMESEYTVLCDLRAGRIKKAVDDHSGLANLGATVGSWFGPLAAIAGGVLGGLLGDLQLDEQFGEQFKRIENAFVHTCVAYDHAARQIIAHLQRRWERFQTEVAHALAETHRRLAAGIIDPAPRQLPPGPDREPPAPPLPPPSLAPTRPWVYLVAAGIVASALVGAVALVVRSGRPDNTSGASSQTTLTASVAPAELPLAPRGPSPEAAVLPDRPTSGMVVRVIGAQLDALRACGNPGSSPIPVNLLVRGDGGVTSVLVGAPYAGTPAEACISAVLGEVRFPPSRSESSEVMFRLTASPSGNGVIVVPGAWSQPDARQLVSAGAPVAAATAAPPMAPSAVPAEAPPAATATAGDLAADASEVLRPAVVEASSFISNGRNQHAPDRAFDGDPATAWNENERGPGDGAWIAATFSNPVNVRRVRITTGYDYISQRHGDLFAMNSHLRRVRVTFDGGQAVVRDVAEDQRELVLDGLHARAREIRIEAQRVWPGTRWSDLCLSEVTVEGAYALGPDRASARVGAPERAASRRGSQARCTYATHTSFHLRAAPVSAQRGAEEVRSLPVVEVLQSENLRRGSARMFKVRLLDGSEREGWMFIPLDELDPACTR